MLTEQERMRIEEQAEALYPSVCCGVVMIRPERPTDRCLIACDNVQDEVHAEDPEQFPLQSQDGYYVRPLDLLTIAQLANEGYVVAVIYYARIDKDACFSEVSRRAAMPDGYPMYPQAIYVPISVIRGRVVNMRGFRWDAVAREFVEVDIGPGVSARSRWSSAPP